MRELQRLTHVHLAMVEMALGGATNGEIARAMGKTDATVSIIMRSPLFQEELSKRRKASNQVGDQLSASTIHQSKITLEQNTNLAAEKLRDLMTKSPDEKIQQTSAIEILKRTYDRDHMVSQAGGQNGQLVFNLGPEALLQLQLTLKESYQLEGKVVPCSIVTNQQERKEPLVKDDNPDDDNSPPTSMTDECPTSLEPSPQVDVLEEKVA